jgi:hypothetical protein
MPGVSGFGGFGGRRTAFGRSSSGGGGGFFGTPPRSVPTGTDGDALAAARRQGALRRGAERSADVNLAAARRQGAARRGAERTAEQNLAAARRQGAARRGAERRGDEALAAARRQGAARRAAERARDAERAGREATLAAARKQGALRRGAERLADTERTARTAAELARDSAQRIADTNKGRAAKLLKLAGKLKIGNKKLRRAAIIGVPSALAVGGGLGFLGGYVKGKKDAPEKVIRPPYEDIKRPGVNAPSYRGEDTSGIIAGGSAPSSAVGGRSGGGYRGGQSSMTDTMKRNQQAVRDAKSYLGEAFDATVQKGVATGRKHLAAMLQRDGVDNETGMRLMNKYDKEIGSQESLKGYKTSGLTEEFDAENPNKRGALLEAYRGKYAKGTTLQQMREKASASR